MIGTIKLFEGYSGKNRKVSLQKAIVFTQNLATVTYAHHSLIQGNRKGTINGLIFTIILAIIFTSLQGFEYYTAPFTISDGAFGSTFYFATGFHGLHVIIGTIFIATMFWRILAYQLTDHHHVGFESSILYWHFVDVVWLFLYCAVYWWGS